jgi:outer membrane protein OmpA-like peptidoglycan-associated protein
MDSTQSQAQTTDTSQPAMQNIDVFFRTASAKLSDEGTALLTQLGTWAKCNPKRAIILDGHADPRGGQEYNVKLSAQRAASARQVLIDAGVPSAQIVVAVYGKNGPRRATYAEDRRVSARTVEGPVVAGDLPATKNAG